MNKELSYTDDILKEVSRKLSIPLERVEDVYKSMIMYIGKLTQDEETLAIRLPHIGVAYATFDGLSKKKVGNRIPKNIKKKQAKMFDIDLRTRMGGNTGRNKHLSKRVRQMGFYTGHYPLEKLQEIQNKRYYEKKGR